MLWVWWVMARNVGVSGGSALRALPREEYVAFQVCKRKWEGEKGDDDEVPHSFFNN